VMSGKLPADEFKKHLQPPENEKAPE